MLYPAPYALQKLTRAVVLVAAASGVSVADIKGASRTPIVCRARWATMHLMRARGLSTPQIGRALNRDHTTVLYGLDRVKALRLVNPDFDALCRKVAG